MWNVEDLSGTRLIRRAQFCLLVQRGGSKTFPPFSLIIQQQGSSRVSERGERFSQFDTANERVLISLNVLWGLIKSIA